MSEDTTFRCQHCGAVEVYDESRGFYLVGWWAHSERFNEQHRACKAPPAPAPADARGTEGGS